MNPTQTLFAGRLVDVTFQDGATESVRVRQLPLADYEKAFALLADEMALTALICDKPKEWLTGSLEPQVLSRESARTQDARPSTQDFPGVSPDSYELLHAAAQEVNAQGFFVWSVRRATREREAQAQMITALGALPPETVEQVMKLGTAASSPTSSPKRR